MPTAHIESKYEDIASVVLMPGDPYRAKYIADNYLDNAICVNDVRGMLAYTGIYKNKKVTVFASGMGSPSIGIYAYELYKFYNVDTIIRIGSCGAGSEDVNILDVVIADSAYTLTNYPKLFFDDSNNEFAATQEINDEFERLAKNKNISYKRGKIITSDVFDVYVDDKARFDSNYPKDLGALAIEMEAATLFAIAKHLNKKTTCLLTVVDSKYTKEEVSSEDREKSLKNMIQLALDII